MKRPGVLLADDEPLVLASLCGFLEDEPWDVLTASDGRQALRQMATCCPDVAVLDWRMPGLTGFDVLEQAKDRGLSTDIVIMTGFGSVPDAVVAMQAGAIDFMEKPVRKATFIEKIKTLIAVRLKTTHVLAERLVAFVASHAADPDMALGRLIDHFHVSKSYACRLFGDMGTSFTDVLVQARIDRAKHLMATTDTPLYVIAEASGFRNARRFSEAFLRLERCPPSQYRKLGRPERKK